MASKHWLTQSILKALHAVRSWGTTPCQPAQHLPYTSAKERSSAGGAPLRRASAGCSWLYQLENMRPNWERLVRWPV